MKSKILPIAGDASFRTFYRLVLNKTSKIIILAKKEKYKNLIVYSTINKFLRSNKIFELSKSHSEYRLRIDLENQIIFSSEYMSISFEVDPYRKKGLLKFVMLDLKGTVLQIG